jgi:hypothetical protein
MDRWSSLLYLAFSVYVDYDFDRQHLESAIANAAGWLARRALVSVNGRWQALACARYWGCSEKRSEETSRLEE